MEIGGILADCLAELGWSPERLARQVNARHGRGTVGATTPYGWLSGRVPRGRLPQQVADLMGEHLGRPLVATDLWPKLAATSVKPIDGKLPVAEEILPLLHARAADLRNLCVARGGGHATALAGHELALVGRMITDGHYDRATGLALHRAFAELSCIAGYSAKDAGRHRDAESYWAAGLRAARLAGDRLTNAYLVSLLAKQAALVGSPGRAIHLARIARTALRPLDPTMVHVMSAIYEAFAHGATGDESSMRTAIEDAHELAADCVPDAVPPCVSHETMNKVTVIAAGLLLDIGRPGKAATHLEEALAECQERVPPLSAAAHTALLARIHLTHGDLDEAVAQVNHTVDVADSIASHYLRLRAEVLRDGLMRYRSVPMVREAIDRLTVYLS